MALLEVLSGNKMAALSCWKLEPFIFKFGVLAFTLCVVSVTTASLCTPLRESA